MTTITEQAAAPGTITGQVRDAPGAPGLRIPGFTGQGWSTHETMLVVRWLFANPDVWDQAMQVARAEPGNPHTVADTLHEHLIPRSELDAIAAAGFDPAKVNWLEVAHELIERRGDPQPGGVSLAAADPGTLTGQAALPAAAVQVIAVPLIPGEPAAVSMFTAHRLDDGMRHLAHATERMTAARKAGGDGMRAYHSAHIARNLAAAMDAGHDLTANIREHYPAEAAELEAVRQSVGLAKAVSDDAKAATTAHLLETTLHEETHGARHAEAMLEPGSDAEWAFNADHCAKHLGGAVEHAGKLRQHFADNYPAEAGWLAGLEEITAAPEDGEAKPQHAGYAKGTVTAQMANAETITGQALAAGRPKAGTITGQLDLSAASRAKAHATASATARLHAREHELRDEHGRWTVDGDVMHYSGSLGIDRKDMPQISGTLAGGRYAPSSEMMPKFLDHLKAKGVTVTRERVPASSLKPAQMTGDMRAVRGIAGSLASGDLEDTKPVLVSSDNRVIDGHHQWAAHILGASEGKRTGTAPGEPVIRADLPAGRLMDEARQFARDQGIQNRKTGVAANPLYARPSITEQAAPEDSLAAHTLPDGTTDPERAALHQRIISDILAGHQPQEHPVATFFGGGPAAGKSTALKAGAPDSAVIDSDQIKARLPEYQQMLDAKDPRAASYTHEESSAISKQAMAEARRRRISYVLDSTGDGSIDKLAGKVNDARKAGYMTDGRYVTVGTDEAVRRAEARAQATGRHVPEETIRQTHRDVSDAYAKAAQMGLFDKTELWDNNGPSPVLVAHKEPGGKFTVADQAAWQAFLDKRNQN